MDWDEHMDWDVRLNQAKQPEHKSLKRKMHFNILSSTRRRGKGERDEVLVLKVVA